MTAESINGAELSSELPHELNELNRSVDKASHETREKLSQAVQAEVFGGKSTQSIASHLDASKAVDSQGPETHPSHFVRNAEIAGIAIAGTALIVAGAKFKPLKGLAESVFKIGGEGLSERAAGVFAKYPELGIDGLVTKITNNLNQGCLTRETFNRLVDTVAPADRDLASAIARRSLPNASDVTLMHSLRDMGTQLEGHGVNLDDIRELTSANAASPGQTTAYLFRKANALKVGIHNLQAAEAPVSSIASSTRPIFLFDHPSSLDAKQMSYVRDAQANGRSVFLMDTNNFHGGINFTDFARGTAESKLQSLVEQAKVLAKGAPQASHEELAYRVLNAQTDRDAASIGATVIRPQVPSDDILFRQMVNKEKVEAFLARYQNPHEQRLAAETLADIDYDSFASIAKKTLKLGDVISADAKASGMDPSKDIRYLVGVDNFPSLGASSGGFISSIYREMNGIGAQKFVDFPQMYFSPAGSWKPKRTYVLDDMSHSGEQIREVALDLFREHGVRGLNFSTISALSTSTAMKYSAMAAEWKGMRFLTAEIKDPLAESSKAAIKALKAEKGFFSSSSDELVQAKARRNQYLQMTKDTEGRNLLNANQLNPYVVSDRTNPITADFADEVLHMHQSGYFEIKK